MRGKVFSCAYLLSNQHVDESVDPGDNSCPVCSSSERFVKGTFPLASSSTSLPTIASGPHQKQ